METPATTQLGIEGMTCAACQIHVRKALEKTLALDRNFRLADDAKKVLAKLVY